MSDPRFVGLVQSLLASAEAALGETDSVLTRALTRDGILARRTGERSLELLLMLQTKTYGNLDETERDVLNHTVATVQKRLAAFSPGKGDA